MFKSMIIGNIKLKTDNELQYQFHYICKFNLIQLEENRLLTQNFNYITDNLLLSYSCLQILFKPFYRNYFNRNEEYKY